MLVEETVRFVAPVICSGEHPTFLSLPHSHTLSNRLASPQTVLADCSHTYLGKHFLSVWNLNLSSMQARQVFLLLARLFHRLGLPSLVSLSQERDCV